MTKVSGGVLMVLTVSLALTAWSRGVQQSGRTRGPAAYDQVQHGRQLVLEHGCGDCHGGELCRPCGG
jgi:hypothetical protein